MLHRREVDVTRRLAPCAADFQPREAAVDGLVDRRRRIDRLAVAPHPLIPTFAEQPICPALHDQSMAFLARGSGVIRRYFRAWLRPTVRYQPWLLDAQNPLLAATEFSVASQFAEKCNCPQHRTPDLR
jgi:hypothetical protein